jgi:hypothetical protein
MVGARAFARSRQSGLIMNGVLQNGLLPQRGDRIDGVKLRNREICNRQHATPNLAESVVCRFVRTQSNFGFRAVDCNLARLRKSGPHLPTL